MPVKGAVGAGKRGKAAAAAKEKVKVEPKVESDPEGEEEDEEEESEEEEDAPPLKKGKGGNGKTNARSAASRNMAFDKGTYIFRLSDLELDPVKDCVWRVDNHQLLQRYNPETDDKQGGENRKYTRTQNYTGWMCQEGWDYIKLEVTGMYRNMGKEESATVKYPTQAMIDAAKKVQAKKREEQGN